MRAQHRCEVVERDLSGQVFRCSCPATLEGAEPFALCPWHRSLWTYSGRNTTRLRLVRWLYNKLNEWVR